MKRRSPSMTATLSRNDAALRRRKLTGESATKLAGVTIQSGLEQMPCVLLVHQFLPVTCRSRGWSQAADQMAAIDGNDAAGHVGTCVRGQQQQRAVEFPASPRRRCGMRRISALPASLLKNASFNSVSM